jgi:hypothetical protein
LNIVKHADYRLLIYSQKQEKIHNQQHANDSSQKQDKNQKKQDPKDLPENKRKRQNPWTHVHSHYAMMGGFALDPSWSSQPFFPGPQIRLRGQGLGSWDEPPATSQEPPSDSNTSTKTKLRQQDESTDTAQQPLPNTSFRYSLFYHIIQHFYIPGIPQPTPEDIWVQKEEPGYKRLVLTDSGILFLARYCPEALPDLSCEEIEDQSKANGLTKILICFQAIWFCVQCVTRLAFNLSISLLELNTCGHSVCALLLAFLWWYKPLDVDEPTLIPVRGPNMEELCAFMCIASDLEGQLEIDLFRDKDNEIPYKSPAPFRPTSFPLRDVGEVIDLEKAPLGESDLAVSLPYAWNRLVRASSQASLSKKLTR